MTSVRINELVYTHASKDRLPKACAVSGPVESGPPDQPPEASCTLVFPAVMNGIMARSSAPTCSIW